MRCALIVIGILNVIESNWCENSGFLAERPPIVDQSTFVSPALRQVARLHLRIVGKHYLSYRSVNTCIYFLVAQMIAYLRTSEAALEFLFWWARKLLVGPRPPSLPAKAVSRVPTLHHKSLVRQKVRIQILSESNPISYLIQVMWFGRPVLSLWPSLENNQSPGHDSFTEHFSQELVANNCCIWGAWAVRSYTGRQALIHSNEISFLGLAQKAAFTLALKIKSYNAIAKYLKI